VWALLDPEICHMNVLKKTQEESTTMPEARVRVTTRFTHPLTEALLDRSSVDFSSALDDSYLFNPDELEQVYLDDLFSHFLPDQFGDT
jgi:hypothetical protein